MKINLILCIYPEKNSYRLDEIIEAINCNITNEYINKLTLVQENIEVPKKILKSHKVNYISCDSRQKFIDLFAYFLDGYTNIICNNDIILKFGRNKKIKLLLMCNSVLALTRFELNGTLFDEKKGDSQDTWVFGKNISKEKVLKFGIGNYNMGLLGSDNRILFELKDSKFKVFNLPWDFPTVHNHASEIRNYSSTDRLIGNYLWLKPTKLFSANTFLIYISDYIYRVLIYLKRRGIVRKFNRNY